ncbi:hypothetical protein GGQ73_004298 [Rhizobium skierniewicense]|uniref:Uncharacterized protein n=1 Tax=Rhizobium skierniewicense TaxID=984260 RepID=A0A7W6CE89_9HYPH|nr:hypothetical protein [Rhizobium skierniewicense]
MSLFLPVLPFRVVLNPAKKDIDRQRNQRQRDDRVYKHGYIPQIRLHHEVGTLICARNY